MECVTLVNVHSARGKERMDGAVRESPATYGGAEGAADDFVIRTGVPVFDAEFLKMPGVYIVVCPINGWWRAVAFAASVEFEGMLAFGYQSLTLPHLAGEVCGVMRVIKREGISLSLSS